MERKISFIILLFAACLMQAQQDEPYRYENTLKATTTISPGFVLSQKQTNIYLNGELEYFIENKLSIRADAFWMAGAQQKPQLLQENSAVFLGALYHFHKDRLDAFIGFQPGVSITKPNNTTSYIYDYKLLPNFSPIIGLTFYASNHFNFFINTRYVYTNYYGYEGKSLHVSDIRISAGLGFQIHTKKQK